MRRARSQINNLAFQNPADGSAVSGAQQPVGVSEQTAEIQRRLAGLAAQNMGVPIDPYAPRYAQAGFVGGAPMHNMATPMHPDYQQQPHAYHHQQPQHSMTASSPELDNIKAALERMSSKLQSVGQGAPTSELQNQLAQQQSAMLKQHHDQIAAELLELRKTVSETSGSSGDLDLIQQTLNANYRAISEQIERSSANNMDTAVLSSAIDASHKALSEQIAELRETIDIAGANPEIYAKTLEASHEEIVSKIDDLGGSIKVAEGNPDLYAKAIEDNFREINAQYHELKDAVHSIGKDEGSASTPDLSNVEMRLEEITRAVVALSSNDNGMNNLERIEARVSDLTKLMEGLDPDAGSAGDLSLQAVQFEELHTSLREIDARIAGITPADSSGIDGLASQINRLSEKLDNLSAVTVGAPGNEGDGSALLERLDKIVERVDTLQGSQSGEGTPDAVMHQLEQIAGAIDELAKPASVQDQSEHFASLETQLSEISKRLAQPSEEGAGALSLEPLTQRLVGIEEQLGQSRDIAIELSSRAAEDAINRTLENLPQGNAETSGNPLAEETLHSLSQSLAQLNSSAEQANATNLEAFGAVKDTLNRMAEKLSNIESGMIPTQPTFGPAGEMDTTSHREEIHQEIPVHEQPSAQPQSATPEMVLQQAAGMDQTHLDTNKLVQDHETYDTSDQLHQTDAEAKGHDLVNAARQKMAEANQASAVAAEALTQSAPKASEMPKAHALPGTELEEASEKARSSNSEETNTTLPKVDTPAMEMDHVPEVPERSTEITDDKPLEPGTGGPDLAALVRQANERRKNSSDAQSDSSGTDFIAAARRAAQAAAQEAGALEEEVEDNKKKGLVSSLSDLFVRRKKVVIMAAAAALLVALAVPLANKFLGGQNNQIADASQQAIVEQVNTQAVSPVEENTPAQDEGVTEFEANSFEIEAVDEPLPNTAAQSIEEQTYEPPQNELTNTSLSTQAATIGFVNTDALTFVAPALKAAVQNSDPAAMFEVARRYTDGNGVEKNLEEAAIWYARSAGLGFAPAQYVIGNFNEKGLGVEADAAQAATWYELAAKGGNIVAMHNLAVLRATPNAITAQPDLAEAFKWFSKAAEYGVRDSQVNAGIFYTKGVGTEVDLIQAYKWFAIAAKAGDGDAASKRDVIADALRPDQLEQAKALVENWQPLEVEKIANEVDVPENWKNSQVAVSSAPINAEMIAKTQFLLGKLGYDAGPADGLMGSKTRTAIAQFQEKVGLQPSGEISDELMKALEAVGI